MVNIYIYLISSSSIWAQRYITHIHRLSPFSTLCGILFQSFPDSFSALSSYGCSSLPGISPPYASAYANVGSRVLAKFVSPCLPCALHAYRWVRDLHGFRRPCKVGDCGKSKNAIKRRNRHEIDSNKVVSYRFRNARVLKSRPGVAILLFDVYTFVTRKKSSALL